MRRSRFWRGLLATALATALAALTLAPSAVAQSGAPAGMHRFVVAIGGLDVGSRQNWVRLGNYSLTAAGEVFESHFHWSQRNRVRRTGTGVRGVDCVARACEVHTANGFQASSPPQRLEGTYTVTGSVLRITWVGAGWEEWTVSEPIDGRLAALGFRGSSFGATHGYGYGSNAAWSDRASMAEIAAYDHTALDHDYHLWKTDAGTPYLDEGSGSPFWMRDWQRCDSARCLGGRTPATEYYLATANPTATDRRDTLWHWRTALADGRGEHCYTGNSHVKPMMQIIDSDGGFHGWVAVEASLNETVPDQGTSADDIGVFQISAF
ncbi:MULTISPECIES: hypothetical protein [Actinoalloteichus]|uniref:Uncharacterized protein n=1 Tax=Actinoalloteichus fjordicus TaxID=1612552 RepID=A0AAC9LD44_9PSEU|nr:MULTISPECIES: hypothetical protein [Actinoalloteichus]APU15768.1 hypothetical protein UA74_18700 [Actinoalloteichus fjordicus]APU21828.1 hypothetical protein UA75_19190 [Actinoalloteichus sp. GBA129-24]